MKSILFVHQISRVGGASFCLLQLLKGLDKSQFKPTVLLCSEGPLVEELKKEGIDIIICPRIAAIPYNQSLYKPSSIITYKKVFTSLASLSNILKTHKFDIVYLNNMMLYPYLKIAKKMGCRTVIHVREHWPLNEHVYQLDIARSYVKKYADKIIAINKYSASIFSCVHSDITIVHDSVDFSDRYKPMPYDEIFGEPVYNKKVFLYTGGFSYIKGIREVLSEFVKLKGDEFRLLVLGVDPNTTLNGWKNKMKKVARMFGYHHYLDEALELIHSDHRIKCINATYEIKDLLDQAYCSISFYNIEHANLGLAESILCNCPCIAAETSESLEYSNDGRLALLYKFRDIKQFESTIHKMIDNYNYFKDILVANSTKIKSMFDRNKNNEKINSLLLSL